MRNNYKNKYLPILIMRKHVFYSYKYIFRMKKHEMQSRQ